MTEQATGHEVPVDDPRPGRLRRAPSLVLVNTGDGKGKSTAAIGIVVRAVARGWRVVVVQFIKSGEWRSGEETVCRQLGVDWWTVGEGFTWDSSDLDADRHAAQEGWRHAAALIGRGHHDLVVLDEVTYPVNWGWIDLDDVMTAIEHRPAHVNVVVTGRDAPAALVDLADTVTEMRSVRHAYQRGIRAARGIDY